MISVSKKYGCQGNCGLISICAVSKRAEEITANILSLLTPGKSAAPYVTCEKCPVRTLNSEFRFISVE